MPEGKSRTEAKTWRLDALASTEDALELRSIRNLCREFMTNSQSEIPEDQQLQWFNQTYLPSSRAALNVWLIRPSASSETLTSPAVGYCLLRSGPQGEMYITEGLLPSYRGQGLGSWLLTEILNARYIQDRSVIADILVNNESSIRLHEKFGFVRQSLIDDKIVRYERPAHSC